MTERISFLLLPGFAMMSAASSVEPLRAANRIAAAPLYDVQFLSAEGGFVAASCGGGFETDRLTAPGPLPDHVFVVAGGNPFAQATSVEDAQLRRMARHGVPLGGISGGSVVLARAGLLDGRRCTVHWEHLDALREAYPDLLLEKRLFVLDRDRATCAGGVAPLDMMHALIQARHGAALATAVSDFFIHTRIRAADDPQQQAHSADTHLHRSVAAAIRLMEDHIADPLSLTQLARLSGVSPRQLQRHFQDDFGHPIAQHYSALRLAKAAAYLQQTRLSIIEIATLVGFSNQSNFARAFRGHYGVSPRARRG